MSLRLRTPNFFVVLLFLSLLASPRAAWAGEDPYEGNACVFCHQNLPGKLSGVVHEWRQSVHFQNNVGCDSCHGGDPAVTRDQSESEDVFKDRAHARRNPDFFLLHQPSSELGPPNAIHGVGDPFTSTMRGRAVSYFCGNCHSAIKEKHLGSPHGDLGSPTCLYCHGEGSHAIQKSSVEIIDPRSRSEGGRCATCHRAATMETVSHIHHILANAEQQLTNASRLYDWLEHHGYKNLAMKKMYHHSRETLSQLRQTFHSFNMREINEAASTIKTNAEITQETYNMIEALGRAKGYQSKIGIASVAFLLSFAGLLLAYRRIYYH